MKTQRVRGEGPAHATQLVKGICKEDNGREKGARCKHTANLGKGLIRVSCIILSTVWGQVGKYNKMQSDRTEWCLRPAWVLDVFTLTLVSSVTVGSCLSLSGPKAPPCR